MTKKKNMFLIAAVAGVAALASSNALASGSAGTVKCWGANACKGKIGCGVSKKQITAIHKEFGKDKFKHAFVHDCGGEGKCAAKKGQLGWHKVADKKACYKKGGFTLEKKGDSYSVKKG